MAEIPTTDGRWHEIEATVDELYLESDLAIYALYHRIVDQAQDGYEE